MIKPRRAFSRMEFVVVSAIIAILVALLAPVVLKMREGYRGPPGEMIPRTPPDEAGRVQLTPDLTMVLPPNWVIRFTSPTGPGIRAVVWPRLNHLGRTSANLEIAEDVAAPDVKDYRATVFHASPAYERTRVTHHDSFDDPAWSEYELRFEREGQWWSVTYGFRREAAEVPPVIRLYIDSLRIESAPKPSTE